MTKGKRLQCIWLVLCQFLLASAVYSIALAENLKLFEFQTVNIMTGDGFRMVTDVYLPSQEDNFPVVLVRTPYGSGSMVWLGEGLVLAGYAVVIQNVRGMHGSEGEFSPFVHEKQDGLETLEWILDQRWCNGRVGLWGTSYSGYCAFEIASTGHRGAVSLFHVSGWSALEPFLKHGGAFHLMAHLRWFYSQTAEQLEHPQEAWEGIFRTVPISDFFRGAESVAELADAGYDFSGFILPIMHVTGWYDYIYPNVLQTYDSIATKTSEPPLQHLVVGPWAHNDVMNGITRVGDENFGPSAKMDRDWVLDQTRNWFDHTLALRPIDDDFWETKGVRIFVMGDNDWLEFEKWPPDNIDYQTWYIDCANKANSDKGTGTLSREMPSGVKYDFFVYDPNNPVPTVGGANSHFFPENIGPKDQSTIESRQDVLVYTSQPVEEDFLMLGPIKVILYAATEAKDTDFTAKLVVVRPDGYARNIEDGIIRGRYAHPTPDSLPVFVPRQVFRFEIDCGATALRINKGDKLRLGISSSNFPKYDRNPNTGGDPFTAVEFAKARQTIFHYPDFPTCVVIPVLK
jgi:putative CocE/NonD family hydrolase